jgi:hypothetical protein
VVTLGEAGSPTAMTRLNNSDALAAANEIPVARWEWSVYTHESGNLVVSGCHEQGQFIGALVLRRPTHVRLPRSLTGVRFVSVSHAEYSALTGSPERSTASASRLVVFETAREWYGTACASVGYYDLHPRPLPLERRCAPREPGSASPIQIWRRLRRQGSTAPRAAPVPLALEEMAGATVEWWTLGATHGHFGLLVSGLSQGAGHIYFSGTRFVSGPTRVTQSRLRIASPRELPAGGHPFPESAAEDPDLLTLMIEGNEGVAVVVASRWEALRYAEPDTDRFMWLDGPLVPLYPDGPPLAQL